jgi:cytochrome b561
MLRSAVALIHKGDGMNGTIISKYSKGAIALHWIIGALIIANFVLAQLAESVPENARAMYMAPHKSIGISVLALSVLRLFWRWGHKPPPQPVALKGWEITLSKTIHWLFYFLMIAIPVTGWLMVAAYPKAPPVDFFGLVELAVPIPKSEALSGVGHLGHAILTKVMFAAVLLHIVGALKHQFKDRMPFIQRMWP